MTVTGPDLGIADAYATAALAMGHECAAVAQDGQAFVSDGFSCGLVRPSPAGLP